LIGGDALRALLPAISAPGRTLNWLAEPPRQPRAALANAKALVAEVGGLSAEALDRLLRESPVPLVLFATDCEAGRAERLLAAGARDVIEAGARAEDRLAIALARITEDTESPEIQHLREALQSADRELRLARAHSITDHLTGLANRRYLEERLREETGKALREGKVISLVVLDLDHFKQTNDLHGHPAGDSVLRATADILREGLRAYDVACRYGGEEFALVLPNTSLRSARLVAERMRSRLAAEPHPIRVGEALHVTASFGVASLPTPKITNVESLMQAADEALYLAKRTGRNCVVAAQEDPSGIEGEGTLDEEARARVSRLSSTIRSLTRDAARSHLRAVETLVRLVQRDQRYAFGNAHVVSRLSAAVAFELGLDEELAESVRRAALLQDLGMIAVGPGVTRAGELNCEERSLVEKHPALSVRMIEEVSYLRDLAPLILSHHERLDGTGYPRGLSGDRIPLGSRILTAVSAYEAMTTGRPYNPRRTEAEALAELTRHAGHWFDPAVVEGLATVAGAGVAS
jgi:diguanylate cyclase (GGDEF)-like protein